MTKYEYHAVSTSPVSTNCILRVTEASTNAMNAWSLQPTVAYSYRSKFLSNCNSLTDRYTLLFDERQGKKLKPGSCKSLLSLNNLAENSKSV